MKNKIVERIQKEFSKSVDLIIKPIKLNALQTVYIVYLESVTGSNKVNDYVLKNMSLIASSPNQKLKDLASSIPAPNTVVIEELDQIEYYITNGFTIVIKGTEVLALETKADINRSVPEPLTEQAVFGPKDAFTENIQINLGLVKRRIKSKTLKSESLVIGRKTSTAINVLYFEDIAESDLVDSVKEEIQKIDVDGILDSGTLMEYFQRENNTHFPTVIRTERPDHVANALMEGKIVLLVDTTPFALILPAFFADFMNPITDNYNKSNNINLLKVIRFLCFFISMMAPAIYIALINYNPETIPTSLLINFAMQRDNVPFPAIIEALLMLFIYEILRESDIRFPNSYGSAISILGALILGEAAVNAGFVSPIMIIVVAFTFITSLIFTEQEIVDAIRYARLIFITAAALFGLYGIVLAFLYYLIHMVELKSLGKPYFYPIAPFDKVYFMKGLLKSKSWKSVYRSKMLTDKNFRRQRRNES